MLRSSYWVISNNFVSQMNSIIDRARFSLFIYINRNLTLMFVLNFDVFEIKTLHPLVKSQILLNFEVFSLKMANEVLHFRPIILYESRNVFCVRTATTNNEKVYLVHIPALRTVKNWSGRFRQGLGLLITLGRPPYTNENTIIVIAMNKQNISNEEIAIWRDFGSRKMADFDKSKMFDFLQEQHKTTCCKTVLVEVYKFETGSIPAPTVFAWRGHLEFSFVLVSTERFKWQDMSVENYLTTFLQQKPRTIYKNGINNLVEKW